MAFVKFSREVRERMFLKLQMRLGSYVFTNQPFIQIVFNRAVLSTASVEINSPGHEKQPTDLLLMGLLCLERPTSTSSTEPSRRAPALIPL